MVWNGVVPIVVSVVLDRAEQLGTQLSPPPRGATRINWYVLLWTRTFASAIERTGERRRFLLEGGILEIFERYAVVHTNNDFIY